MGRGFCIFTRRQMAQILSLHVSDEEADFLEKARKETRCETRSSFLRAAAIHTAHEVLERADNSKEQEGEHD